MLHGYITRCRRLFFGFGYDFQCKVCDDFKTTEEYLITSICYREYPCDHYTAVINVTLMNTGCPRPVVRDTALQLLQILDKRFFGVIGPLAEGDLGEYHSHLSLIYLFL